MSALDFAALGRRGGLTTASSNDMREVAEHARRNAPNNVEYFFAEVDPDGTLNKSDREARARAAQRLYFTQLAKRSAARRRRPASDATNAGPTTKPGAANTDPGGTSSDVRSSE